MMGVFIYDMDYVGFWRMGDLIRLALCGALPYHVSSAGYDTCGHDSISFHLVPTVFLRCFNCKYGDDAKDRVLELFHGAAQE